jgi:hypothetical protein
MAMTARDTIEQAWSWIGLAPDVVLQTNAFGNVVVRARDGKIWRICPEELSCKVIADSEAGFQELSQSSEFQEDWLMHRLVRLAEDRFGSLEEGRCYCLKIPAVLGGAYDLSNFGTISVLECLAASGHLAEQIKDLPAGAQIKLVVS